MNFSSLVSISDETSVGEARRASMLAAQRLGFDETRSGEFALLATEVTRNVLRHATRGEAVIWTSNDVRGQAASILALDKGPGIKDITRAFNDGYSTGGTLGMGLGAMKRTASSFDLFTARNGTVVYLEISSAAKPEKLQIASVAVPYPGERFCGDACSFSTSEGRTLMLLVDGLGHGRAAAEAAEEAVLAFQKQSHKAPGAILQYMHDALKKTRGAAAGIAEIDHAAKTLTYAGIGNTVAVLISPTVSRNLVSHNGTLGAIAARFQEFKVEWPENGTLIMHSDGIQSRWDLSSYAGLMSRHPAVIAGVLLRDFRRGRDDASVLIAKG